MKLRILATTGLLTVTLALATACTPPGQTTGTSTQDDKGGPIKVAVVNAQSGQLSSLGKWEYKGVKLAVDEANQAGGINGRKIALTVLDDQGDPTVGTNLARKVASEKYVAMLGTAESAVTLAMAPVLAQAQIPNITSGQSPKLAQQNTKFLFLNSPTSTTYDETLAKYVVGEKGIKSIAMVTNNGAYGAGEREAFTKALADLGVQPVADAVVTPDQKDFSSALTSIRQRKPQALFIGAEEVQSGLIVKQARELGVNATIIGGAPLGTDVFLQTAGTQEAEGAIASTPYPSNDFSPAAKKFGEAYQKAYNETAELHGAKAYDGAKILIQALKDSDLATGKQLADAIRAVKYDGLVGSFAFDENGVGVHQTRIATITGGQAVPVSG